jgi:hypothetical protein
MLANYVNGGIGTAAGQAVCVDSKFVPATYTGLESFGSVENRKYVMCFLLGSWFRASAMTTMNKKPTRCTIVLKSLIFYCILIPLYMFRALLRPSSGDS